MRRAGSRKRAALALRLGDETVALARRAIARARPDLDLDEMARDVEFVRIHYGAELATRLERWLHARRDA